MLSLATWLFIENSLCTIPEVTVHGITDNLHSDLWATTAHIKIKQKCQIQSSMSKMNPTAVAESKSDFKAH